MPTSNYSISYNARLATGTTVSVGYAMVLNSADVWVVATSANRASFGRSMGIALSAYGGSGTGAINIQHDGVYPEAMAAGLASWVRVDANGALERVTTPSGSDDVIGYVNAYGDMLVMPLTTIAATASLPLSTANGGTGLSSIGSAGQVLKVNAGATALEYGAGGSSTPTGTGFRHVTAGVEDAAAALVVNADVDAAAAIAGSKISPDFGAQNVTTTGAALLGATPRGSTGAIRVPNNVNALVARNAADSADVVLVSLDNFNYLRLGASIASGATAAGVVFVIGGVTYLTMDASALQASFPIVGNGAPYGCHGSIDVDMNNANHTLTAAQYKFPFIIVTSTANFTANRTLTVPLPGSNGVGFPMFIANTQGGAFSVVVTNTGGGPTNVTIAQNRGAWVLSRPAGIFRMSADSVLT